MCVVPARSIQCVAERERMKRILPLRRERQRNNEREGERERSEREREESKRCTAKS